MATGTTQSFNVKRNEIIDKALREIRGIPPDAEMSLNQLDKGISWLNIILKAEDAHGTGQNKNLWALDDEALILQVGSYIYSTADGLRADIMDMVSAFYRDTGGNDTVVRIVPVETQDYLVNKQDTGPTRTLYIKRNIVLANQIVIVNPVIGSQANSASSMVVGTDGKSYQCILKHTSAAVNQPVTGNSWSLFWTRNILPQAVTTTAWVTATAYTNSELIRYTYKRPLFEFNLSSDNPDMPQGWGEYLIKRLAHALAPSYGIALDERQYLEKAWHAAREEIFPSTRPISSSYHDKALHY